MKAFSSNNFGLSVDNLLKIFNESMESNYIVFSNDLNAYLDDPYNKSGKDYNTYCPEPSFKNWLHIDRRLVSKETEDEFKSKIMAAGWEISQFIWQRDDRTASDTLYINVKKN